MEYPWQKGFLLMPFMMILSFVGISRLVYMSVKIKKNTEFIKIIFLSISTLITCLLMLSFMYVSLRYRLDFYGFCWITSVVGVHYLVKDIIKSTCFSKVCFVLSSVFLTFVGIYYSLQTVMLYKTIGISSNPQSWEFAKKYADLFM
jgi:hypothetical protein